MAETYLTDRHMQLYCAALTGVISRSSPGGADWYAAQALEYTRASCKALNIAPPRVFDCTVEQVKAAMGK